MEIILFGAIVAIIVLFTKVLRLEKINKIIFTKLSEFDQIAGKSKPSTKTVISEEIIAARVEAAKAPVAKKWIPPTESREIPVVNELADNKSEQPTLTEIIKRRQSSKPIPTQKSEFWIKLEKQVSENWTGILGSVIMVVGVGFLGIYAAVKLAPVYRFMMITAFSGLLFGTYVYLRKLEKWIQLGLWLRSSAAAIFLFACLGSGGIEGLKWIDNPLLALVLLLIGIGANLALSWLDKKEAFASLHVVLSLVAISLAPQSTTTLILATIIALVGIARTYRVKWDYQLISVISVFFIYHIYWFTEVKVEDTLPKMTNMIGIASVLLVGIASAFVHYRAAYKTKEFVKLPFVAHMMNWLYLGMGLMLHATGSQWKTIPLTAAAIGAYFLARHAKKLEISWLYKTDTLIALATALFAAFSLAKWGLNVQMILAIAFAETMIFSVLMYQEKEEQLYRIGSTLMNLISIGTIAYSIHFLTIDFEWGKAQLIQHTSVLLGMLTISTLYHLFCIQNSTPKFELADDFLNLKSGRKASLLTLISGIYVPVIFLLLRDMEWAGLIIVVLLSAFLFLRQKFQSLGLLIAVGIMYFGSFLLNWYLILTGPSMPTAELLVDMAPFLVPGILALIWDRVDVLDRQVKWPGIYLLSIQVFLIMYFVFEDISPLIFGVAALLACVLYFELSNFLSRKYEKRLTEIGSPDRYLLHLAYGAIAVFMVRHIYIHLQVEDYIGIFKLRLLIELLAIAIIGYCAFLIKPLKTLTYKSWSYLHPLLVELVLVFASFTIALEVDAFWHPIAWVSFAFLLPIFSKSLNIKFSRLKFYGVLFYWISAIQVAFLTTTYVTPSTDWFDQSWLAGLVAIGFMFGYVVVFYKKFDLKAIDFPPVLSAFTGISNKMASRQNPFFIYPLVLCVAIFLYWSFDKSVLTLLWVIECMAVFVLSIILREQQFRYVALSALAICIVRLVFFDLAQSGTLTKALVFLGVGVIMLAMNAMYNKYKQRFIDE